MRLLPVYIMMGKLNDRIPSVDGEALLPFPRSKLLLDYGTIISITHSIRKAGASLAIHRRYHQSF